MSLLATHILLVVLISDLKTLLKTEFASGRSSTYGWLLDTYRQVASWLRKRGIGRGDRIAFYSKSFIEYTPCLLAIWRIGATCTYMRPEMIGAS